MSDKNVFGWGHQIGNVLILVTCKCMFLLPADENWLITKRTAYRSF